LREARFLRLRLADSRLLLLKIISARGDDAIRIEVD
jgi:hypothetical protein